MKECKLLIFLDLQILKTTQGLQVLKLGPAQRMASRRNLKCTKAIILVS